LTMAVEPVSVATDQSAAGNAQAIARCSLVHLYS